MEVVHPEVIIAGLGEVSITAPEGCTISLVKDDGEGGWEILAVATATGDPQTIEFVPQVPPTEINLVVTGQNYLRYEAVMGVIPADGPYIVYDSKVIHDNNGNQQLDFGETISLDVTLKNVGSDPMNAFEAVLETESEYITITNGTAQYDGLAPNATQNLESAFSFNVADNVPDNTSNRFTITVTNGDDVFVSNLVMKAYAPVFDLGNLRIIEVNGNGNGRLDAGETAQLSFPIENIGHADAAVTTATLQMLSPYITVAENTVSFENLNAGETATAVYDVTVSEETPLGYSCPLVLNVTSGRYEAQSDYTAKVGLIVEDFETGEFGEGWTNDPQRPWTFVREGYEGVYCVKSGGAGVSNVTSSLSLTHEAGSADSISFYYKVSSESGYDKLHFYIDNTEVGTWSGTVNWTKAAYAVNAGTHTYRWSYTKDGSVNSGSDCGWIDFVSLPAARVMAGTAGYDVTTCEDSPVQIVGYAIHYDNMQWTTFAPPIYPPGQQDIANGQATLTLTINGGGETITDEMTVFITENVEIDYGIFDKYYCASSEPQIVAVDIYGDYTTFSWSTSGDGVFEDPNELFTNYTPGPMDIANGVTLYATAQSEGCGPVVFEYNFDMNPLPQMTLATNAIEICEGENAIMNFSISGSAGSWNMFDPEFTFLMNNVQYEVYQSGNNSVDLGVLEVGEHVFRIAWVHNLFCYTNYEGDEMMFTVTVNAAPTMTIGEVPESICEGEEVNIEFTHTQPQPDRNVERHFH